MLDSGLVDLIMHGYGFTWCKHVGKPQFVEEKLDCGLCTEDGFTFLIKLSYTT